jgi:hypothetical protein
MSLRIALVILIAVLRGNDERKVVAKGNLLLSQPSRVILHF